MSKHLKSHDSKDSVVVRLLTLASLFLLFGLLSSKASAGFFPKSPAGFDTCSIRTTENLTARESATIEKRAYVWKLEKDMNFKPANGDFQLMHNKKDGYIELLAYVDTFANISAQWIKIWHLQIKENQILGKVLGASTEFLRDDTLAELPSCYTVFENLRWQSYFSIVGAAGRTRVDRSYNSQNPLPGLGHIVTQAEAMIQYGPGGKDYETALLFYRNKLNTITEEAKAAVAASSAIEFEDKLNEARKVFVKHLENYCAFKGHPYLMSSLWGKDACVNCVGQTLLLTSILNDNDFLRDPNWRLGVQIFEDHIQAVYWNARKNEVIEVLSGKKLKRVRASIYDPEVISFAMSLRSGKAADSERDSGLRFKLIDFKEQHPVSVAAAFAGIVRTTGDWSDKTYGYLRWNRGLSIYNPNTPPEEAKTQYKDIEDEFPKPKEKEKAPGRTQQMLGKGQPVPKADAKAMAAAGKEEPRLNHNTIEVSRIMEQTGTNVSKSLVERALSTRCQNNCSLYIDIPQIRIAKADEMSKFLPGMVIFTEPRNADLPPTNPMPVGQVLKPKLALVFKTEKDRDQFLSTPIEDHLVNYVNGAADRAARIAQTEALVNLPKLLSNFKDVVYLPENKRTEILKSVRVFSAYLELADNLSSDVLFVKMWDPAYGKGSYPSQSAYELLKNFKEAGLTLQKNKQLFENLDVIENTKILKALDTYSQVTAAIEEKKWVDQMRADAREIGFKGEILEDVISVAPQVGIYRKLLLEKADIEISEEKAEIIPVVAMVVMEDKDTKQKLNNEKPADKVEHRLVRWEEHKKIKHKLPSAYFAGLYLSLPQRLLKHPLVQFQALQHWTPKVHEIYSKSLKSDNHNVVQFATLWSWSPFLGDGLVIPQDDNAILEKLKREPGQYLEMSWRPTANNLVEIPLPSPRQRVPEFIVKDLQAALDYRLQFPVNYSWSKEPIKLDLNKFTSDIHIRLGIMLIPAVGSLPRYVPNAIPVMGGEAFDDGSLDLHPELALSWDDSFISMSEMLESGDLGFSGRAYREMLESLKGAEDSRLEIISDGAFSRSQMLQIDLRAPTNDRVIDVGLGPAG